MSRKYLSEMEKEIGNISVTRTFDSLSPSQKCFYSNMVASFVESLGGTSLLHYFIKKSLYTKKEREELKESAVGTN
jgi:hypothetical protein